MPWLLLVTGGSRGLGAALIAQARAAGHLALGISRSGGAHRHDVRFDLGRPEALADRLIPLLRQGIAPDVEQYILINNAAVLGPVGMRYSAAEAEAHIAVNLLAPIVLSRVFVDALAEVAARKRIVNLSSGAATRAIPGWSLYGASKAGLDHFGRVLAAEQALSKHPVDVVNLSPGVIDTDMQVAIRASTPEAFPQVEQFRDLHARGALQSPESVAERLLAGLAGARRFTGETLDLDTFASGAD